MTGEARPIGLVLLLVVLGCDETPKQANAKPSTPQMPASVEQFLNWLPGAVRDLKQQPAKDGECEDGGETVWCMRNLPPDGQRYASWLESDPSAYLIWSGPLKTSEPGLIACDAMGYSEVRHWRSGQLEVRHCTIPGGGGIGLQAQRMPGEPLQIFSFSGGYVSAKETFAEHLRTEGTTL